MLLKHINKILLFLIVLLAAFLRLYQITGIPPSLSRDEVSLGYNAFSVLKTMKDEYGRSFPLSFEAFGDWKLPLNVYILLPFIAVMGLTEYAVRLPVAILGTFSVLLVFLLGDEIRKKYLEFKTSLFSLLAALFLALSPWHIYMSRTAFGHNVEALFFLLLGLYFFFKGITNKFLLIFSAISFSLTLFFYTSYTIFLPFFAIGLLYIFRQELSKNNFLKTSSAIFIALFVLSQIVLWQANFTKIPGSSVTSDNKIIYYRIERKINEHKNIDLPSKLLHNKFIYIPYQISLNYLSVFSSQFLVDKGGENPINNLEEMGNIYIWDVFLIVLGLYYLIRKKEKIAPLILLWLLLSPLPGAFTKDAPHSTRTLTILGAFVLIEAYGIASLCRRKLVNLGLITLVVLYVFSTAIFAENYFFHFPLNRARFWGYGFKQAVELSNKVNPDKVVMTKIYDSPYIYYLFYKKFDPKLYQKEARRAALTWDGFRPVNGFNKYMFVDGLDWNHVWDSKNTLYIDEAGHIPKNYPVGGWINYPFGDRAYGWFVTTGNPCRYTYPSAELTPKICR